MKKIIIILFAVILWINSCENFDNEFPDYEGGSSIYFPYQLPVRTIILGDYIYDNSNDLEHKFIISAGLGGVYQNKVDRKFTVTVDESLCDGVRFPNTGGAKTIRPLPSNYYRLSSTELVIPKGKFQGGIEIELTDDFFEDIDAITNNYVVPLRLNNPNNAVERILTGTPGEDVIDPDPRIVSDWVDAPKNFTLFGIKYVNEYFGTYLYYGSCNLKSLNDNLIADNTYQTRYVEQNPLVDFVTIGRYKVQSVVNFNFKVGSLSGDYQLELSFDANGHCTISGTGGVNLTKTMPNPNFDPNESEDAVTNPKDIIEIDYVPGIIVIDGTGNFIAEKAGTYAGWGNKDRNVISVDYTVRAASTVDPAYNVDWIYSASEKFVVRNRDIRMETYSPARQ